MSDNERRYEEALAKIAEAASDALNGGGESGEGASTEASKDYGCIIKTLPKRLLAKAADTAIKLNPANGLNFGPLADLGVDIPQDPARIAVLVAKYWGARPRQLTVSFMESTPADLRNRIISHMNAWTRTGCISFAFTQGTGQVRISRGSGGYYSYLGTDILHIPQNRQTMNLQGFTMATPEREYKRVVRHETGHTLGFPHEHMRRQLIARLDRNKTYAYFLRTQGWDRATVDAQVLTPLDERSIRGTTQADQDSIMCYQLPGEITLDGRPIRGGLDIDQLDYAFCGSIYPRTVRDSAAEVAAAEGYGNGDEWSEAEDVQAVTTLE